MASDLKELNDFHEPLGGKKWFRDHNSNKCIVWEKWSEISAQSNVVKATNDTALWVGKFLDL